MPETYFEMWIQDRKSIINTMARNMAADLSAGYNPLGDSIRKQRADMDAYIADYETDLMALAEKTEAQTERWCRLDLIRRGAIEL